MDSINNACKFGSDAWLELQAFKTRQLNRREKLNRHKNLQNDLISGTSSNQSNHHQLQNSPANTSSVLLAPPLANNNHYTASTSSSPPHNSNCAPTKIAAKCSNDTTDGDEGTSQSNKSTRISNSLDLSVVASARAYSTTTIIAYSKSTSIDSSNELIDYGLSSSALNPDTTSSFLERNHLNLELVECLLLLKLCDVALKLPIDSRSLQCTISKIRGLEATNQSLVKNLLQKFAHQELITIEEPTTGLSSRRKNCIIGANTDEDDDDDESCIYVTSADHTKLVEFDKSIGSLDSIKALLIESKTDEQNESDLAIGTRRTSVPIQNVRHSSTISTNVCSNNRDDSDSYDSKPDDESAQYLVKLNSTSSSSILQNSSLSSSGNGNEISVLRRQQSSGDDLESLLSLSSTRERESKKLGEELLELLSKPTAKERNLLESFRSADGYQVQEFCPKGTKGECRRNNNGTGVCDKLHFKKIIAKHTEESLGDCSFLNTCFHMDSCKYVHYEVDYDDRPSPQQQSNKFKRPSEPTHQNNNTQRHETMIPTCSKQGQSGPTSLISATSSIATKMKAGISSNKDSNNNKSLATPSLPGHLCSPSASKYTLSPEEQAQIDAKNRKRFKTVLYPPQWIQCDLRFFDMSLLGKFSVVMADPPWDIHMELPYGTMSDDEMRKLNIPALQDEGVIFLWVTGRAMELGRECLSLWGYERCDEIIWVKTNQLQRIIRTGRTGHWLNHGKEHCLVGVKGNPKDINRGLDCDVIVAEVRATSHKPDEIYGIIERLSPGTRKIELFGRAHNVQPNWITLGNQLNGVRLIEPNLVSAFKKLNLPFQTADHAG